MFLILKATRFKGFLRFFSLRPDFLYQKQASHTHANFLFFFFK